MNKNIKSKSNGFTLISLVVVLVIMSILAGILVYLALGNGGVFGDARKAKIKNELYTYIEELEYYISCREMEDFDFDDESLNAGVNTLSYNTQPEGEVGNIKTIITSLQDKYVSQVEIIKGEISFHTTDLELIYIAQELGIEANPYDIVDGTLLSSNNNLLLMDSNGTLTLPDSVKKIGVGAFANCTGLKTIIIPGTCKEIESNAFSYNPTLEKVIMEDGVQIIGSVAFGWCDKLKEIEMPDSVISLGGQAFYCCSNLQKVNLSNNIKVISSNAFSGCSKVTEIIIPEGVTTLQGSCFAGMGITEIDIPKSVTTIQSGAFINCTKLENINFASNDYYFFSEGVLSNKAGTSILFITTSKLKESEVFVIPEGMTSFGYALQSYSNIKKLVIPSTLTSLSISQGSYLPKGLLEIEVAEGNNTFISEDKQLYTKAGKLILCFSKDKEVTVKEGIKSFGTLAFSSCQNTEIINLPESATELGYMTFNAAPTTLKTLNIGKNITTIDTMFKYQHYSGTVNISEDNPNYTIKDKVIYTKDMKQLVTVTYKISGTFTVIEGVEKLQKMAFHAQGGMKQVILPSTLKEIVSSFGYCTGLTSITIPASVTKIGSGCFANCNNLSTITINKPKGSISGAPWGATKGAKVVVWAG